VRWEWSVMFILFASPFFRSDTPYFIESMLNIPDVRLGIISMDPIETLEPRLRRRLAGHMRVSDILDERQIQFAAQELQRIHGKAHRLLAINEQIQVPVACVRERLEIDGMPSDTVRGFRDKSLMKQRFRKAGVPCAKHCAAISPAQAWAFVEEVGFPICVKPVDGAAAQSTYKVGSPEDLEDVLRARDPSPAFPLQMEEFVTGQEHSFESFSLNGKRLWHSLSRYLPTPLDVMRNPWIQWRIVLPKEIDTKEYKDIEKVNLKALKALGMDTGMGHMEWFRRKDGSLAVGEIGCRPPGAQLITITNRAHDFDLYTEWCRLMILGQFNAPTERKYAAGVAFLRGMGGGRVQATHGLAEVLYEFRDMVTDYKIPQVGEAASITYEGEGWVIVRHPETSRVEEVLEHIVKTVRVELVH
jgi:biotin carboxylase